MPPTATRIAFRSGVCRAAVLALIAASCGASADPDGPRTEARLLSTCATCAGQRASLPASVARTYAATVAETRRLFHGTEVIFQVEVDEMLIVFLFVPTLPLEPTTEELRAGLMSAYAQLALRQPTSIGGSLDLLPPFERFGLDAFDELEVRDGRLTFRLTRTNQGHYWKQLSSYDDDPTNDPPDMAFDCLVSDITGMNQCEFSGPPVTVTMSATAPFVPTTP